MAFHEVVGVVTIILSVVLTSHVTACGKLTDAGLTGNGVDHVNNEASERNGFRLHSLRQFFIVAPRVVRPDQAFRVYVTIFQLVTANLTIQAVLSNDDVEYGTGTTMFTSPTTRDILIKVPPFIQPGTHHKLTVIGLTGGNFGFPVFKNETYLDFDSRYISLFVQTDRPVYYPPQKVTFRIIGTRPNLKAMEGGMTIYLKDGRDIIVRRWLMKQLKFGFYESSFELSYPVNVGQWHIVVDAFGHTYEHGFDVRWYWTRHFEVNVSAPLFLYDTDRQFEFSIYGENVIGHGSHGNASIAISCREEGGDLLPGRIFREIGYISGSHTLGVRVADLEELWGALGGRTLLLEAWIHDWEYDETQNSSFILPVYRDTPRISRLGGEYVSFHPGKPLTVYFALSMVDGSMYTRTENRTVYIDVDFEDSEYDSDMVVVPDDSIVKYTIIPDVQHTKITFWARYPQSGSTDVIYAYKYYSHKGNYVTVTTSTPTPITNEYMIFTVRANFFASRLHYILMAKGEILLADQLDMYSNQKTFSVAVSRQMAPRARVVVYCIQDDEVVMDAINFYVTDSQLTNASLALNLGKNFRRTSFELIGRDRVGSFMLTVGHDWEWTYRGAGTHLLPKTVVRDLYEYDEPHQPPHRHVWYHNDIRWDEDVFFSSDTNGLDTNSSLYSAGLVVMTDLRISHAREEELLCNRSLGLGQCISGTCFDLATQKCNGVPDCPDGYDEAACPLRDPPTPRAPYIDTLAYFSRYYVDTDWLFTTTYLKPNLGGQAEVTFDVPAGDMNPYVFHAAFIHPEHGLSLASDYVMYEGTRTFMLVCEAPGVLKRGEQVGVRCSVKNFWDQYMEVMITLHGGDDFRFINVEEFGIVSSYNPRTTAGDVHTMLPLFPGTSAYFYMPILPIIESGSFSAVISAFSTIDHDVTQLDFDVIYDGMPYDDIVTYLVDLFYQGSLYTPYFEIPIPEQFYVPGNRDLLYIPGSNWASVSVFGDVVTGGFYEDYFTTESATGLPHDSAEGYMFDFAINLVILQYLESVDELSSEAQNKALEFMTTVLMRQYSYLQEDGSVKMFRRTEKPSTLLTSFMLHYLHMMFETEWVEQVYIPSDQLNKMALWLTAQQTHDGAFVEAADFYYNRNFYPITTDNDGVNHTWHVALTAHCVITLAEARRLTGLAKTVAAVAVDLGCTYLAGLVPHITDPLQMAITAYALYAGGHPNRDDAYSKLKSMQRVDRNVYWCHTEIPPNEIRIVDTKHLLQCRAKYPTLSNGVMATSYALKLYLLRGEFEESRPIMKWLNEQRMNGIFWISVPDSLLALEALTEYAKRETNHEFYNMEIVLEATSSPGWREVIRINESTFPGLYSFDIPVAWGEVSAYTSGTGFAFVSVSTGLHVEKEYLFDNPDYESYDFYMQDVRWYGRNASIVDFFPCVKWGRPDVHHESGLAISAIDIPTGFVVDRDEIERLYLQRVPGLQRVRFRDSRLWMFWEVITQDELCFMVTARRWYPVANSTVVQLYSFTEYSEPHMYRSNAFSSYTLFHLHICQVCGSFQCPYCPWYNTGSYHTANSTLHWWCGLVVLVILTLIRRIS